MYHLLSNKKISTPSNREVKLLNNEIATSRTDIEGNILYYNHTFSKISGYEKNELLSLPHSMLRHPDMPKALFYFIWKALLAGQSTHAIIKNFTKEGDYYWVLVKFIVQKDNQNNTVSFLSHATQASRETIETIEPFYQKLLEDEKEHDMISSVHHLLHFLNNNNIATYNDYICKITKCTVTKEKKPSFFSRVKF